MVFARRQIDAISRRGHQTESFYLASRTSPAALCRAALSFRRRMSEFEPDIIHAQFGTVTSAFAAALSHSARLVITFRGSDINPAPSDPRIRQTVGHALSHLSAYRADSIICVSAELARKMRVQRRISILPSGVDR